MLMSLPCNAVFLILIALVTEMKKTNKFGKIAWRILLAELNLLASQKTHERRYNTFGVLLVILSF